MKLSKIHVYIASALLTITPGFAFKVSAQSAMDSVFTLSDTVPTLTLDEFYKIILSNHPVVKQAELLNEIAQQEIRLAKGSFDPKVASNFDHKEFQNKTYYNMLDASLSFPTWFPVNPKIGYQRNTGELLNPEDEIPGGTQIYTGLSIPIGKGLFTDERRTTVKQAQLFANIAAADQVKIINKILLEASKDYWQWYYAYYNYRLSTQAVAIAKQILSRIKINMEQGEAAMIDTLQAKISLQSRSIEMKQSLVDLQNSVILISNYLWDTQSTPIELGASVAPVMSLADKTFPVGDSLEDLVERARENHPDLTKLSVKLDQLDVERRLARELLKPQLDLNYSLLSQPSTPHQFDPQNDYKFGVDFSFPVFLRKERAKLALTRIKIANTEFQKIHTEREIINQVNVTFNELMNYIAMIEQQAGVVELYSRLLASEMVSMENGESDLFRINIQQERLLISQSKLLKLTSEVQKLKSILYWSAGVKNLDPTND